MKSFNAAVSLGVISRFLSIATRFISVPLIASLLTEEKYGLWLIATSIVGWLAVSDLGMPAALQNRLILLLSNGQVGRARSLVTYSFRLLGGIGIGLGLFGTGVGLLIPWEKLFPISTNLLGEFAATLCLCCVGFALGLPTRIGVVLYNGHGELQAGPIVEIAAQVATLALLIVAVVLGWNSLFILSLCSLAGVAMGPLAASIIAIRRFGYSIRPGRELNCDDRQTLLSKGAFFAVAAIGELLILQSDAILIGSRLGPAAVPAFVVPATLFLNFLQMQNIYLRPLWPLLTAAAANGDPRLLGTHFKKALIICTAGAGCFALGLVLGGDWFIRLWSKGVVTLPLNMAIGFGIYAIVAAVDSLCATFLNAAGKIEYRCGYTLFFGMIKTVVAFFLIPSFGVTWLPLVFAGIMLLCSIPFAISAIMKLIRPNNLQEAK